MTSDDIGPLRVRHQKLAGTRCAHPTEVVRWHAAMQSQDYPGAKWAIAQRCSGVTDAALDRAVNEGAILRTHLMRPTWHFVLPEDIRWILDLTAQRVHRMNAGRHRVLGLDARQLARTNDLLARYVENACYLTRAELATRLAEDGIDSRGERMAHILMHAELDGVICSGPRRDRHFTYALLDERAPAAARLERDEALVQLALRYFRSHGPATAHDFSWWSGLTVTDARRAAAACGPHLREHSIDGATYWSDAEVIESTPIGGVRLLPNFDEHTVAYRNHAPSFHSSTPGSIGRANGGVGLHVVLSDGYVVGVWQRLFARASCSVRVQLFRALTRTEAAGLEDAAGSYARFLELPVTLAIEP